MIQNYQLTKTKQSKLNKQQQHQTFIPNLLPPQSSTSLATNLDYLDKNYNQSTIPLRKFQNDDLPIEISDDEKIKSDDDNQQQIKNNLNTEQLLLKSEELNNEQHKSFMNTNQQSQYQIDNKNSFNDNDKKINYNNKNINENRSIEINNDLFSSDHDGGNTDYNIGGDSGGGSTSINNKLDKQQRKEHKKGKKIKEGKIKKKKDKKDKTKNKEKYDKKQRMKDELNYTIRKDKEKSKKLKKEKKKDKQRLITANPLLTQETQLLDDFSHKSQLTDLTKISNNDNNGDESSAGDNTPQSGATTSSSTSSSSAVPKLTLKLGIGKSPTPDSIESRKIIIKSTGNDQQQLMIGSGFTDYNYRRDPSPELARISPLVTRPPKQKSKEKDKSGEIESPSSTTANIPSAISSGHYFPNISGNPTNTTAGNISNIPSISGNISIPSQLPQSMHSNPVVSRGPGRPKGSGNKNPSNIHNQPHPIGGIGGIGSTIVSGLDLNEQQSSNIIHPPIPSSTVHQPTMLLNTTDADGNQVWICPACGRVDDGTPMIGCDGCDAWYHWVCVGIQVPPDDNEDWYCRVCITKKQDVYESDKKKKRKKKNKTN